MTHIVYTQALAEAIIDVARCENAALRERIDEALSALSTKGATNYEKVQAAGLILARPLLAPADSEQR